MMTAENTMNPDLSSSSEKKAAEEALTENKVVLLAEVQEGLPQDDSDQSDNVGPLSALSAPSQESLVIKDAAMAEAIKNRANAFFAAKKYTLAVEFYTEAISFNPTVPAYYTNRAFANIRLEKYGSALSDADFALKLDPTFIKAYYRRAVCNMSMGHLKDAIKDFRSVVKVAPQDADARKRLTEAEKEWRKEQFEKAIAVEEVPVEEMFKVDEMVVEPSYTGPTLAMDEPVTLKWVQDLLDYFKAQKKLHRKYAVVILLRALEMFRAQPTIVDVTVPAEGKMTICGDIHGQFYDLLNVFDINGLPSPSHYYLWNGDFVDRGSFSIECIMSLMALKLLYPAHVFLSRGNHETINMNKVYGFQGECQAKYNPDLFRLFTELFNAIPLGNVINGKILVVHGGLFSRDGVTMDEVRAINRFKQPGDSGLMCELLWSDPQVDNGRSPSERGIGIRFGPDVTKAFLDANGLTTLIRSHEVREEGYSVQHDGRCITIFSAPNYCDSVGNMAAYIHVSPESELKFNQYTAVPHPPIKAMAYASSLFSGM